jgi:hypothetical protein
MNIRLSVLRSALAGSFAAAALVAAQANAANDAVTFTVDTQAPLHATLMPTVTITADSARPFADPRMSVADVEPLSVTLLPTVHVSAHASELAVTELPTIHVVADAWPETNAIASTQNERNIESLARIERDTTLEADRIRATRNRVMPQ